MLQAVNSVNDKRDKAVPTAVLANPPAVCPPAVNPNLADGASAPPGAHTESTGKHSNKWVKGMPSPNPAGRPAIAHKIRALAQEKAEWAFTELCRLAKDSDNEQVQIRAMESILKLAGTWVNQSEIKLETERAPEAMKATLGDLVAALNKPKEGA